MIVNSMRWRLQAWHGLILVMVLAGFGVTAYQVERESQRRRIDEELNDRLMTLVRPGPPPGEPRGGAGEPGGGRGERKGDWPHDRHHDPPRFDPDEFRLKVKEAVEKAGLLTSGQSNGYYFVLWAGDGSILARSAGAPADVPRPRRFGPPEPGAVEKPNERFRAAAPGPGPQMFLGRTRGELREAFRFGFGGDCLLAGRSLVPDLAAMRRLAIWLTAAGAGVLLLGLAGGWWVATRAIRPIEDISATAVKIAAGDLSQRINAADTESELGRLAGVLNSTFARLEAAFAHQARFTSDASHELRTPISVILSQTQMALARERPAAEYREALAACQRAAERMRRLAESLLQLARLDAGQEPMRREPFDLARVARECVDLVRPLATERGLEIRCDLSPIQCVGDAERLGQVAANLLTNAIHYNSTKGEVRVATRAENGAAWLVVADSGQGIHPDDLPHIFERFYRADKSRSSAPGHTGLGLAISKAIVDAHGGVIEVVSQAGTGSTFSVKLPLN